ASDDNFRTSCGRLCDSCTSYPQSCYVCSPLGVGPLKRRSAAMAEIIRIAESASEPVPQALPQNVEAEAALLGALMIDNRLVEDVQLKLRPDHFFESLHGRIYEAILRMTDANRVANPVTLRPLFESDESIKEVGGPAYLAQL